MIWDSKLGPSQVLSCMEHICIYVWWKVYIPEGFQKPTDGTSFVFLLTILEVFFFCTYTSYARRNTCTQ